jgi:hypothetical protein
VHEPPGRAVGIDRHPAHGIHLELALGCLARAHGGEQFDGLAHVAQRFASSRLVEHAVEIGCEGGGLRRQHDLPSRRQARDSRCEVDRRSEVVVVTFDGASVMEADAHGRGPMAEHEPVGDVQAEKDRLAWVRDAQHDRVADRLHMRCARR